MATLSNKYLTLLDLAKRKDMADGPIAVIIEMLAEINPIIGDALAVECNNGTTHRTTVRTGLPTVTWKRLYEFTQPSKSTTKQVDDTTGMLEAFSEVDEDLVELSGDPAGTRLSEASAFIEAMGNEMATGVFYHSSAVTPEKFHGFAPRFADTTAANGANIVLGDGVGSDNTSIWFIVWGERQSHLLFPKGTQAGLQRKDLGTETKTAADGGLLRVMREQFKWKIGLSVRDWRYVARVGNIDVTNLVVDAATGTNLLQKMTTAYYKLRQRKVIGGKAVIYCNTTIMEFLDHHATQSNSNVSLSRREGIDGGEVLFFKGIPIHEVEALTNTEATIT